MNALQQVVTLMGAGGSIFDADALAYITATGISDSDEQNAINTFVLALKSAGIWTKLVAVYIFPPDGSAAINKYNLKDPQDTDAAFRLTFGTAITHGVNGVTSTGVGSTNVVNTKLTPSTHLPSMAISWGIWPHTAPDKTSAPDSHYMGGVGASGHAFRAQRSSAVNNNTIFSIANITFTRTPASLTSFLALSNNLTGPVAQIYENGSALGATQATTGGTLPIAQFYLMRSNQNGSVFGTCAFTMKFAFIGTYLTGTEMSNFASAVSTLQTDFGR
jgi:hypothetical protein